MNETSARLYFLLLTILEFGFISIMKNVFFEILKELLLKYYNANKRFHYQRFAKGEYSILYHFEVLFDELGTI